MTFTHTTGYFYSKKNVISVQSFWKSGIYVNRGELFLMNLDKLIERGRQGDETAFESLYNAYHRQMTGICQRIVRNHEVAEELAHDAFLLAFAKINQLHDPQRFEAWLTSITTNVARRYMQRHHEPVTLSLTTISEDGLPQETAPTHDRALPTMAELMAAIDALPNGYGQVFKLAVIQEMSHKEIAEILGIAAHSSSSQLSRAKKMLQKSLAQYWLLWLLPFVLPLAIYLYKTGKTADVPQPVATKQENTTPGTVHDNDISSASERNKFIPTAKHRVQTIKKITWQQVATVPINDVSADTVYLVSVDTAHTDTMTIPRGNNPLPEQHPDNAPHIAEASDSLRHRPADMTPDRSASKMDESPKWSVDLAYSGSIGERKANAPFIFTEAEMIDVTSEIPHVLSFSKWSDYAEALQSGVIDVNWKTLQVLTEIAQNNAAQPGSDNIERTSHHYMPITVSLALKYRLNNRLGIETGLSYSRLRSESEIGKSGNAIREQQTIHYLGIPLKGICKIYDVRRWNFYGSLGAQLEIPVHAPLITGYYVNGIRKQEEKSTFRAPLQWSVGAGLGLQYNLTPNIGFFAEPSLQYYIPTGSSIETFRTEHPFIFSLPLGIRLTW